MEVAEHEGVLGERELGRQPRPLPQVLGVAALQREAEPPPAGLGAAVDPLPVGVLHQVELNQPFGPLGRGPAQLEPDPRPADGTARVTVVAGAEEELGRHRQVGAAPEGDEERDGQVGPERPGGADLGKEEAGLAIAGAAGRAREGPAPAPASAPAGSGA